jgi:small subunit ribosomal protein S29
MIFTLIPKLRWCTIEVISWINSTTPYTYDPRTKTFQQPELAAQILGQFITANSEILLAPSTQITKDIKNERLGSFSKGDPLSALLSVGQKHQSLATEVLAVTLEILGEQTKYVRALTESNKTT